MTVFEELVDELKVDNLIDENAAVHEAPPMPEPVLTARQSEIEDDPEERNRQKLRAEDEFASVQLIESLLDGVLEDPSRSESSTTHAADARKALASLRQLSVEPNATGFSHSITELTKAVNAWRSALEQRDARIEAGRLRLYCENSHPPLSAKSLIELAGLYRRALFSDQTRDKFDFVMTRLFTCEGNSVKREMRFPRAESIDQIKKLYKKWDISSVEHSGSDRDKIFEAAAKFGAFAARVDAAPTFADLFRSDIPSSIRELKKSLGETIFEPEIMASVMDCNVRIGNRFVEIAALEKQSYGSDAVSAKYGDGYDEIATESAVRTLRLAELLESPDLKPEETVAPIEIKAEEKVRPPSEDRQRSRTGLLRGVNKWLLAVTILVVVGGVAAFFLIKVDTVQQTGLVSAKPADISNTEFEKYFSDARTTESTLYVSADPEWDVLTADEKKKVLKSAFEQATKKGMRNVRVLNKDGKGIAFASELRQELTDNR